MLVPSFKLILSVVDYTAYMRKPKGIVEVFPIADKHYGHKTLF